MKGILLVTCAFAIVGCAGPQPVPAEFADTTIQVCRLTGHDDMLELETYETFGDRPEVIPYVRVRFRVTGPESFAGREISIPIVSGTENCLFEQDCFGLTVPRFIAEGKDRAVWIDGDGRHESVPSYPMDGRWIMKKAANQALQTTPMTRSVYEKTIEFGRSQRGV